MFSPVVEEWTSDNTHLHGVFNLFVCWDILRGEEWAGESNRGGGMSSKNQGWEGAGERKGAGWVWAENEEKGKEPGRNELVAF